MSAKSTLYISRQRAAEYFLYEACGLSNDAVEQLINRNLESEERLLEVVITDDSDNDDEDPRL